jgi:hypothetical protein
MQYLPLNGFEITPMINALKTYRKPILKANSHEVLFKRFIEFLAQDCQFQTQGDKLLFSIRKYISDSKAEEMDQLTKWMLNSINQQEQADLIPNISIFIMENYEKIFNTLFTNYVPFEKVRFTVDNAKAMSRTDFAVKLRYGFRNYELKIIKNALVNSTEAMIRAKTQDKINQIKADKMIAPEEKESRINKAKQYLEEDLSPEKLLKRKEEQGKSYKMVARYLIINTEKAFNIILDKIIRYHYKRLNITTPVQYITNVSKSEAIDKKNELTVIYWISSREW